MDVGEVKSDSGGGGGGGSRNYELLATKKHVMITDVTSSTSAASNGGPNRTSPSQSGEKSWPNGSGSERRSSGGVVTAGGGKSGEENKFFVEEPFDFVFEPDHYPHESAEKKPKLACEEENDPSSSSSSSKSNQHKYAQVIRELDDGMLEYEYKSFTCDRSFYTNKLNDDLDSIYFQEFNSHLHMRAESLIRGVSLSRWPHVGFGFELATARIGAEPLIYVNHIDVDSPAALSSLRLGDVLIEVDEIMLPVDQVSTAAAAAPSSNSYSFAGGTDEAVLKRVEDYMASRDNLHLMVVHESQYVRLKAEDDYLLKNYYFNCEDIVVVNVHNNRKQQHVSID